MSTVSTTGDKIVLHFSWKGPTLWTDDHTGHKLAIKTVDLVFKGAKTAISVDLPNHLPLNEEKTLPFICRKYHETGELAKETYPDSLSVTIEQIRRLTVKVGIFPLEQPTDQKQVRTVELRVPEELEAGETYGLTITSNRHSLSAQLAKERKCDHMEEKHEFQERMAKMGGILVEEGWRNLTSPDVLGPSPTTADIGIHGMEGILRAGRQMHPDLRVPPARPSASPAELDKLSIEQLQALFTEASQNDLELEVQRMQAAFVGDIETMNRVLEAELPNTRELVNLAEALKRKGVEAQIPQTESFRAVSQQSAQMHAEALRSLEGICKIQ